MTQDKLAAVARAIWLEETFEGWDDGSGVEKRVSNRSGLLVAVADFEAAARAAISAYEETRAS